MVKIALSITAGIILGVLVILAPLMLSSSFTYYQKAFKLTSKPTSSTTAPLTTITPENNFTYQPTLSEPKNVNQTSTTITTDLLAKTRYDIINIDAKIFLIIIVSLIAALIVFLYAKRLTSV